jgi:glycerophosphoryl diester phosphodiesterase
LCNNKKYENELSFFDIQGHRGCRGLMPENTIIGFTKAVDIGVTTLEMDVVITKDGQVVVSHDPFFSHEITSKKELQLPKMKKRD